MAEGRRVYGVSTGFGLLANTAVDPADLEELQRRIVLSHATATGDPLDVEVVRGMQLLRARTLTQGFSGSGRRWWRRWSPCSPPGSRR